MKASMSWQMALAIVTFLAFATPLAEAQALGRGQGGPGRGRGPGDGSAGWRYDVTSEITITGSVTEVLMQAGRGGATGLHLQVTADGEVHVVHVGPTFYLLPNGLEVTAGDQVTVTGSSLTMDGQLALIAREISKGDFTLVVRDEAGLPLWRGQGPRSAQGVRGPAGVAPSGGTAGYGRGYGRVSYTGGGGRGYGRASFARGGGRGARRGFSGPGLGRGPCGRGLGRGVAPGEPAAATPPATAGGTGR